MRVGKLRAKENKQQGQREKRGHKKLIRKKEMEERQEEKEKGM